MTTEQINRAIGKALGWTCPNCGCGLPECSGCDFADVPDNLLPNFAHDLNAMHEVEKTLLIGYEDNPLGGDIWDDYEMGLIRISPGSPLIHATARHRAEAFLRVKGLWEGKQ